MRRAMIAMTAAVLAVGLAGCAGTPRDAASPGPSSPTATPSPTPSATASPGPGTGSVALPAAAARRWTLSSDATLGVDLRTPGRIVVRAGCVGYAGSLATTAAPDDPTAGAPAGPTVSIRITPLPDEAGTARCMGFTAAQQEFTAALKDVTVLTVAGDRLYLVGDAARLEFDAAS